MRNPIAAAKEIDGWMDDDELFWLAGQAAGARRILEVGVWKGRSLRVLGDNCPGTVDGLDPWKPYSELHADDAVYAEALCNVSDLSNVLLVRGDLDAVPAWKEYDFIFIDSEHTYEACKLDIERALLHLRPGGRLAGHDFWNEGVRAAVEELFGPLKVVAGQIWTVVPDPTHVAWAQSVRDKALSLACFNETVRVLGRPHSFLDVGCGDGHLVRAAHDLGCTARGVDLHYDGFDLTKRSWVGERYDLVACWEVAEHLPPSAADHLCDVLADATGQQLVFCAATEGQGGSGHLNEQPHAYWRHKLVDRDFKYMPELTLRLSRLFFEVASNAPWYGRNVQVFDRL